MRLSNLFTALLKEIVNSSKKYECFFEEDGDQYIPMQNRLFLNMVISVQIVSLRSSSLLVIIPFLTNLVNPPPLLSLFLQFLIS